MRWVGSWSLLPPLLALAFALAAMPTAWPLPPTQRRRCRGEAVTLAVLAGAGPTSRYCGLPVSVAEVALVSEPIRSGAANSRAVKADQRPCDKPLWAICHKLAATSRKGAVLADDALRVVTVLT